MTGNLAEFNATVAAFTARHATGISIGVIMRKLMLDGLVGLVNYTPVDTGYLRFNWQASIGLPITYSIGEEGAIYSNFKGHANRGTVAMRVPSKGAIPPFPIAFLVNNVEYAEPVNDGTPHQKANMMVERTEQDLVAGMLAELEAA